MTWHAIYLIHSLNVSFFFQIKEQATTSLQIFIIHYREDPDQQNLIDWIQEDWLQCCGIEGPKDWDSNNYFNCSSRAVGSREACGVPFSCCKRKPHELIKNKQCGYDVRREGHVSIELQNRNTNLLLSVLPNHFNKQFPTNLLGSWPGFSLYNIKQPADRHIYERGCLRASEDWLEGNLAHVAGSYVSVMVLQVNNNCCNSLNGSLLYKFFRYTEFVRTISQFLKLFNLWKSLNVSLLPATI